MRIGIFASYFNGNFALTHISEGQRAAERESSQVAAVVSTKPIFSTKALLSRCLKRIHFVDFIRTVLVDTLWSGAKLYVKLTPGNEESFVFRARTVIGLIYGYRNGADAIDNASKVRAVVE